MTPRTCRKRYAESVLLPIITRGFAAMDNRSLSLQAGRAFSTMRIPALSREDCAWSGGVNIATAITARINQFAKARICIGTGDDVLRRQSARSRVAVCRTCAGCWSHVLRQPPCI
jgi:hypothetical protein